MRANHVVQNYHLTPVLVCLDFILMGLAAVFVFMTFNLQGQSNDEATLIIAICMPAFVMSYNLTGVYQAWRHKTNLYFLGRLSLAYVAVCIGLFSIHYLGQKVLLLNSWLMVWLVLVWVFTYGYRLIIGLALHWFRAKGFHNKTILLIGVKSAVTELASYFNQNRRFGFDVYDQITIQQNDRGQCHAFTPSADLINTMKDEENSPTEVWICLPLSESKLIKKMVFDFKNSASDIRLVPDVEDEILLNHPYQAIMGLNVVDLNYSPLHGINHVIKAATDFVLASLILILISPILCTLALAVKLTSKGPVLFVQPRNGAGGRVINVYKFRSMKTHKEAEGSVTQATKGDTRLTPIGGFIRRTSLDELPQFINVLQGRMSIVGPRPHARSHNSEYSGLVDAYMSRHRVKPGITGWAQISGFRGETDTLDKMEGRIKHDLWYIENWSWWLDIKIVFLTVFKGFVDKNAY